MPCPGPQVGVKPLVLDGVKPSHSVYVYNCHDSVVQVRSWRVRLSSKGSQLIES